MIKILHILLLVPVWKWIHILFMPSFIENFPYENKYEKGKWICEIILDDPFEKSRVVSKTNYNGKLYKAYILTRLLGLKYSAKYSNSCFGVHYRIKKESK